MRAVDWFDEEKPACGVSLRKIEGRVTTFFDAVTCPVCIEIKKAALVVQHAKEQKERSR